MRRRTRAGLWAMAAAGCLVLAACGGGDGDGGAAEGAAEAGPPDVRELLDSTIGRLMEQESFHFVLDFNGGTSPLEQLSVDMELIEGDIVLPDQIRAEVAAQATQFGGIKVNVDIVGIGADAWVTNPFDREMWLELEGGNPLGGVFNPTEGVASVISRARDPRIVGEETIGGVATWRVEGTVDSGDLDAFIETATAGYDVIATIWIGKADPVIYRIHLLGRLTPEEEADILRRLTFSSFNDVEPIEPP